MRGLMRTFGNDGWISMSAPNEFGGQQVPFTVLQAVSFIFGAANYSPTAYAFLTTGAAHLIEEFGSKELQQKYIPKTGIQQMQNHMFHSPIIPIYGHPVF